MALKDLTALAQAVAGASKAQVETAKESVISEVRTTVVKEVVKETMDVEDMDALATDSEVDQKLLDYVRKTDIFENDQFTTRYNHVNGSYAQLFNESDGGGAQYFNKTSDILSYVGTNDGDQNGVCVQIYSKYKDGVSNTYNSGVRINVNPNGAYYTKGTDTSANGGSSDTEIATLADIKALISRIETLENTVANLTNS